MNTKERVISFFELKGYYLPWVHMKHLLPFAHCSVFISFLRLLSNNSYRKINRESYMAGWHVSCIHYS